MFQPTPGLGHRPAPGLGLQSHIKCVNAEWSHQTRVIDNRSSRPKSYCSYSIHHVASPVYTHTHYLFLTCTNGLSLGRYDNNVLVHLNAVFIPQQTWQHDLGSITDGVHLETDRCYRQADKEQMQCRGGRWGRLTALSFITRRLWDTSSFSRGKMTLLRYDSSLLWSNCHWASRTSCIVTMLSWNPTIAWEHVRWCHSDSSDVIMMSAAMRLQMYRWCHLRLCCRFLFQSLIIRPAQSSRTELNTLTPPSPQKVNDLNTST